MTAPPIAKRHPDSGRVFGLRRYLIGFLFVLIFMLLDRATAYLQILPGISAWNPPVGIALALLIGMGPRYAPLLLSGRLDFGTYTIPAIVLRQVFKLDWRLTSIRDVMVLKFLALPLSAIAAFLATLTLIFDQVIPWGGYVKASLNWWVGDAVAIACLTPFCLVLVIPVVRRFTGLAQTALKPLRRLPLWKFLHSQKARPLTTSTTISSSTTTEKTRRVVRLRILLAEDNIVNQRLISRILEKMGHKVVVTSDGATALTTLSQQQFDLVAMDNRVACRSSRLPPTLLTTTGANASRRAWTASW